MGAGERRGPLPTRLLAAPADGDGLGRPAVTQTKPPSSETNAESADLCLQGVSKVYATHDGPVRALEQVSVGARRGESLSLLGPSGCGESALLMIAAGPQRPTNGADRLS